VKKNEKRLPTAVYINDDICGKFMFIFRKKFYLNRKISVTKFATSASREPLAFMEQNKKSSQTEEN
jgi:hypothetical protein